MSINFWRYAEGTDEGCAIYQCLQCYGTWEGRTAPGYHFEGTYRPTWKFCPICGTQWIGQRVTRPEDTYDRQIGPRRQRIREAIDRRHRADMDAYYKLPDSKRGPWPGQYQEPYWLVRETAERSGIHPEAALKWEPQYRMAGMLGAAARMLELARADLHQRRDEYESSMDRRDPELRDDPWYQREFYSRVVVVRDLKKTYPHYRDIYQISR